MSTPPARHAPNRLAQVRLVLSPGSARRGWLIGCALVVTALLAGIAAGHYVSIALGAAPPNEVALQQLHSAQQALEQSRLQLRAADARSHELERQVDALNQRVRECLEELTFFRKARDGRS